MSVAGFVQKYSQLCPDCGGNDFVDDHQQGDLICRVRPLPSLLPLVVLHYRTPGALCDGCGQREGSAMAGAHEAEQPGCHMAGLRLGPGVARHRHPLRVAYIRQL